MEPDEEPTPTERSPEEQELVEKTVRWLERKDGGEAMVCPLCKNASWGVGVPSQLPLADAEGMYPLIPILCNVCGLLMFLHGKVPEHLEREEREDALEGGDQRALEQTDMSSDWAEEDLGEAQ